MSHGCEGYEDALVDRATGRQKPGRAERLDAHLADCADCRAALLVIRAVAAHPPAAPPGLETRILTAIQSAGVVSDPVGGPAHAAIARRSSRGRLRPSAATRSEWTRPMRWALPLAAAAAVALLWIGPGGESRTAVGNGVAIEYEPYGSLPAANGLVAGEPVLSDLTFEELERLLEEMES